MITNSVNTTRVSQIMRWAQGPNILHVGCSDHNVRTDSKYWVHEYLYKNFERVYGIDISADNIETMKRRGYPNLFTANAETFQLGEMFDTIVAGELIEHLSNPGLFFDQARKHLKPNGRLIITTPSPFSLINIIYAWLKFPITCQNDQHAMWFCVRTLRSLYKRYGFKEESMSLIPDYEFDNDSVKYRLFAYTMVYLGFLIPKILKNNDMLFVLTLDHTF